ncbi:hypothetical protein FYK55_10235 [Roseiconus nitratireducens]|uniref:Uncharacterized protein n=1 Tax=Roseiconus nitratireducens TaxID=2605748 RepID=A0A5M6D7Q1_9BACT|nr:OmpH family outer membrane protein [Roseiconus nitratireducens]KAA5543584.1 hypothetical protein FYK55_10235 [Roseiconus nitratireducens]
MATTTKKKFERADEILRSIVVDEGEPDFEEVLYFTSECGWDEKELKRQRRRMHHVVRLQQISGTKQQRDELEAAANDAAELLKTKGQELQEQIEKLQKQLQAMERDAETKQRRFDETQQAVESLRNEQMLRADVRSEYNSRKRHIKASTRADVMALESELKCIDTYCNWDTNDSHRLDLIRLKSPSYVALGQDGRMRVTPKWGEYLAEQRKRIPELERELAEAKKMYEQEWSELERLLDHYVQ